jgi:hypothetical protein
MSFFVAVERYSNWLVDKENEFSFYGLPERHLKKAATIKTGDVLLIYVSSGYSAFAGARRVSSDKLLRLAYGGDYDVACPCAISTEPLVSADPQDWVPVKQLVGKLSFLGSGDWRQQFRTSIKPISDQDAAVILDALGVRSAAAGELGK